MTSLLNAALGLVPLADWHHDGPGWWPIFPLFWIALIVGLFFLFRRRGPWSHHRYYQPRESAAELLERRFAAGEISGEEYRERRSILDPPERR